MTQQNPLLDFSDLPRFDAIKPEHITPAIALLLEENRAVVAQLEAATDPVTWDNFVEPLENATEKLGRAWGIIGHLNGVADTPELRAAYNENQPIIMEFWTALGQNLALFDKYKALQSSPEFAHFTPARQTIVNNAVRDFRLGGAELSDDKKVRYAEVQEKHAALSTKFSENVLDATNDYSLFIDNLDELKGLPDDVLQAAKSAAEKDGKPGCKFTLHFPSYFPLLQYADNRALRETIYRANATKASELGSNPEWDNTEIMTELLALRQEEAHLLGYHNFAEVSLVAKMAETPAQVSHFLLDLANRARPFAEKDLAELRSFAKDQLGIDDLQSWDTTYASEKLREQRYAFSEQELKQYFPEQQVVAGLFNVIETLFAVEIWLDHAPSWHPDVKFYRLEKAGKLVGQFYLDLYARSGKRGGAWMDDARGRRRTATGIQTPVAYLTCNFSEPVTTNGVTKPALFTHDEVITLFHEFGHGLHHLLTQVEELSVSGISGVEWDAVELPSQFMENFCWEWDVLQGMTAHAESGEPLPRALYDKMIAAKNFQSGMQTLRQVEFSLFDMRLHDAIGSNQQQNVQAIADAVRAQVSVFNPPAFNRFQHSFSHIFAGGYAAGYFSYKWAEVLSADAYAAFEDASAAEGSTLSRKVGQQFQSQVLEVGGSRPALESFKAFRGREPAIDALLRHSGMAA
ncbi:M3 family metallopeptidase [Undibacterium sp. RTI2.1]|uniref:M3 family metallopeptidase n=1 Tax=unclassified Undibacterium TaxID=2630295 RepID=UPI002AB338DC|nr:MULTISPECIES: M3 family metallopeptidase [unclassified Undibacterium]MDY7538123.1 M3 family metallopeptidase [Undibacterium sp. 5I1]MEB0032864.1 M3 family metallopeptidase [Undibacterium sp. RTI2.1]MEB0116723.1 M3 family metallopeptidase [Undibacterium sp. RTI2.2]MEB0232885.1 M3 family metallopeptidase [Undibacterium sp. 10I3]MEB0257395.1 M3 family metallopeptidase [Undibacterium sp. 5I1]